MQNSLGSSVRLLTAQQFFAWNFDFEFLMDKANHELHLSLHEGPRYFFPHAMNFSVTIHAIADHLWHVKAVNDTQWRGDQGAFVNWVKTKNDCIAVFIHLSNTYKHSDRRVQNDFAMRLGLYPDPSVQHSGSAEETRNRVIYGGPVEDSFWPVLTTTTGRLIYFRYAAEHALQWWRTYHSGTSA
jgi:hypothetical protein